MREKFRFSTYTYSEIYKNYVMNPNELYIKYIKITNESDICSWLRRTTVVKLAFLLYILPRNKYVYIYTLKIHLDIFKVYIYTIHDMQYDGINKYIYAHAHVLKIKKKKEYFILQYKKINYYFIIIIWRYVQKYGLLINVIVVLSRRKKIS